MKYPALEDAPGGFGCCRSQLPADLASGVSKSREAIDILLYAIYYYAVFFGGNGGKAISSKYP
jgi:hypothetical protein